MRPGLTRWEAGEMETEDSLRYSLKVAVVTITGNKPETGIKGNS
jgi:hypothetical protein